MDVAGKKVIDSWRAVNQNLKGNSNFLHDSSEGEVFPEKASPTSSLSLIPLIAFGTSSQTSYYTWRNREWTSTSLFHV